jgi:hypothetical protein
MHIQPLLHHFHFHNKLTTLLALHQHKQHTLLSTKQPTHSNIQTSFPFPQYTQMAQANKTQLPYKATFNLQACRSLNFNLPSTWFFDRNKPGITTTARWHIGGSSHAKKPHPPGPYTLGTKLKTSLTSTKTNDQTNKQTNTTKSLRSLRTNRNTAIEPPSRVAIRP